jgi:deazaflavin-dependent oxidoreductase (nitroreductase family)
MSEAKRRAVTAFQRYLLNPVTRTLPGTIVLETTGRTTGRPRRVPVGGRLDGRSLWIVSEHGRRAGYVRNIAANPRVRVRIKRRWRGGSAHLLPDDDPIARLRKLPRMNSLAVRAMGTDLLTVRIDLDEPSR